MFFYVVKRKAIKPYFRDEDSLIIIGHKIREIRVSKEMTQMELAFKCNDVDYSQINRIELGKVNFSVSYLILIAKALDVTVNRLLPDP
jgi:transcriptional regulator with XRE-family HTH domain